MEVYSFQILLVYVTFCLVTYLKCQIYLVKWLVLQGKFRMWKVRDLFNEIYLDDCFSEIAYN